MPYSDSRPPGIDGGHEFSTTHWSVVLAAANQSVADAQGAWETLCRAYWYPLYAFIRRQGYGPHDAQDLTQEFLTRLIADRDLHGVAPGRGRFRSFLLGILKHFLSDERKRARAKKRGGGQAMISIDERDAESRYQLEPVEHITPETHFERQWGLTVLDLVTQRLRREHEERGNPELFAELQPCLSGSSESVPYRETAQRLGMSEGAVKVAVHRLRREFGQLLRAEIAQTVADAVEIDQELRHLIRVTAA